MTTWRAASEEQIWDFINEGVKQLSVSELRFFEAIRVLPEQWVLEPHSEHPKNFWIFGIIGKTTLWYNDIEYSFNFSKYSKFGIIEGYGCEQNDFHSAVKALKSETVDEIF